MPFLSCLFPIHQPSPLHSPSTHPPTSPSIKVGGLSVPTMEFGEATLAMDNEHGTLFSGMQGEGILGLAFQGISEHSVPTFLDLLYQNQQIDKK